MSYFFNDLKKFDINYLNRGITILAGVDEAGRGPLAGPVVAAAVIFNKSAFIAGVNDSKKIKEKEREILFEEIIRKSFRYGIGVVNHQTIDKINILQATLLAMQIAVGKLKIKTDLILIDGNKSFDTKSNVETVIKGDLKSFSIAAASIIAKVTRDRIMRKADTKFPQYKWYKNKGYGTREHIEAIKIYGFTPMHRKTFLKNYIEFL